MSKSKTILWVVIVIIVIGIVWWYFQWKSSSPAMPEQSPYSQNSTSGTSLSALPQGNSNTALDQSLQTIDSQLNGLSSDSASVTQGLNDQPISQGQ